MLPAEKVFPRNYERDWYICKIAVRNEINSPFIIASRVNCMTRSNLMRGSSRSEMINESSTAPARIFTITCIEGRRKFPSGRRAGKEKERERESRCFLSSVSKRICTLVHRKHTLGMCRNTNLPAVPLGRNIALLARVEQPSIAPWYMLQRIKITYVCAS